MSIDVPTQLGSVQISKDVLATLAGAAAMDCYGLVGMASQSQLKDGITDLLGRENFRKGIQVHTDENDIAIDLYIVVGYGVKISEVASNVQSKVKYTLEQVTGLNVKEVNIFVQGVRLLDEGE